jgi:hypothetical protein
VSGRVPPILTAAFSRRSSTKLPPLRSERTLTATRLRKLTARHLTTTGCAAAPRRALTTSRRFRFRLTRRRSSATGKFCRVGVASAVGVCMLRYVFVIFPNPPLNTTDSLFPFRSQRSTAQGVHSQTRPRRRASHTRWLSQACQPPRVHADVRSAHFLVKNGQ